MQAAQVLFHLCLKTVLNRCCDTILETWKVRLNDLSVATHLRCDDTNPSAPYRVPFPMTQRYCDPRPINWMSAFPPNSYVEAPAPSVMVLVGTAFGTWFGLDEALRVGPPRMGWVSFKEEETSAHSAPCEDTVRRQIRRGPSPRTRPCQHPDLGIPSLQSCEESMFGV